jgi:hypothetical protein
MGATEFYTHRTGADLRAAYDEAVREAVTEYGNDGYNGTISTTSGAHQATRAVTTQSGAVLWAQEHFEDNAEKWGPALAVPTAEDARFEFTVERFKVTLEDGDEHHWSAEVALEDKARGLAFRRFGTAVHKVEVRPKVRTKVVATAAVGKPVLRWQAGAWKTFDTKAQAVAHAKQQMLGRRGGEAMAVKQVRVASTTATTSLGPELFRPRRRCGGLAYLFLYKILTTAMRHFSGHSIDAGIFTECTTRVDCRGA